MVFKKVAGMAFLLGRPGGIADARSLSYGILYPMLEIETREPAPGITVLKLSGKLMMGPETGDIETLVGKLLRQNRKKLIFDLTGVDYIDSAGLGTLTFCSATMQAGGGALRMAGAQPLPQRLFQVTKLDKILSFYPTVEDACRDF
jgi:anti-sigma B factor antagonist